MSAIPLTIRSITQETADTKTFTFEKEAGLLYKPGQFLTVLKNTLTQEIRRQYSFSSHPALDEYASITVKRIPNGEISRWLFDEVNEGDQLKSLGSFGHFILPADVTTTNTFLFLAAGSGITPILSLIKEVLHFHQHARVILFYSNRSEASTIFLRELCQLQDQFPSSFTIAFPFSKNWLNCT